MLDENMYHLYCFTVVAKHLNYTEAAEILHMTQPALSKIIKSLEIKLDAELFYRNTRKVELTEAGVVFLDKTIHLLNDWNELVKETSMLARGEHGMIRIGFLPYAFSDFMPVVIRKFRKKYPDVVVHVYDGEENILERQLKTGELDVAFVSDWGTDFPDHFVRQIIFEEDYYAVLSRDHPLAGMESITFDMLKAERFLVLNQTSEPRLENDIGKNRVLELCRQYGFLPDIIISNQAKTLLGLCVLVAGGEGIAILAGSMEKFTAEDYNVVFIPIRGIDIRFKAMMCYDHENKNTCIQKLWSIVSDLIS